LRTARKAIQRHTIFSGRESAAGHSRLVAAPPKFTRCPLCSVCDGRPHECADSAHWSSVSLGLRGFDMAICGAGCARPPHARLPRGPLSIPAPAAVGRFPAAMAPPATGAVQGGVCRDWVPDHQPCPRGYGGWRSLPAVSHYTRSSRIMDFLPRTGYRRHLHRPGVPTAVRGDR
jgi:hypothetical protein